MADHSERDRLIADVLKETLAPVAIRSVRVAEAEGFYGDPAYHIEVILDDDAQVVSPEKAIAAMERIREALARHGHEDRLPLLTFLSPEEAEHAAA